VLGGQVLAEVNHATSEVRRFVYAGPTVLAWIYSYGAFETVTWEQRDPSGATERGTGAQELDPLGADAGTTAVSVPPADGPLMSYGISYSPANPNIAYSVDGIRVSVNDFMNFAGMALQDPLTLREALARGGTANAIAAGALGAAAAQQVVADGALGALAAAAIVALLTVCFQKRAEFVLLGKVIPFYIAIGQTEEYDRTVLETAQRSIDLLNSNSDKLTAQDKEAIEQVNVIAAIGMRGWKEHFYIEGIEGVTDGTGGGEGILLRSGVFLTSQIYTTLPKYWAPQIAHEGQHRRDFLMKTGGYEPGFIGNFLVHDERRALIRQLIVYRNLSGNPIGNLPRDPYERMLLSLIGVPHGPN
jgi:hypothetical protein